MAPATNPFVSKIEMAFQCFLRLSPAHFLSFLIVVNMAQSDANDPCPFGSLKVAIRTLEDDSDWSDSEEIRIACVPPRVDQLSDEEDLDEDDLKADAIIATDRNENVVEAVECAATLEVFRRSARIKSQRDLSFHVQNDTIKKKPQTRKATSTQVKSKTTEQQNNIPDDAKSSTWTKATTLANTFRTMAPVDIAHSEDDLLSMTPFELFSLYFNEDFFEQITNESNRYKSQKNALSVPDFSVEEIRNFIAFILFSGIHPLPREKLYWSESELFGVNFVQSLFPRNRYYQIKQ